MMGVGEWLGAWWPLGIAYSPTALSSKGEGDRFVAFSEQGALQWFT